MNKILAEISLDQVNSWSEVYQSLLELKRDRFQDNERIIIRHSSKSEKTLHEIIDFVDIPTFFIQFESIEQDNLTSFSDSHCIYPWINLLISTTGDVRPCCLYQGETAINIKQDSIESAYFHRDLDKVRQQFMSNEKPTECHLCWEKESVGIASMRELAKDKFKDIYYKINYEQPTLDNLHVFDLKLGNHCNLGCRICDAYSSSTIAHENLKDGVIDQKTFDIIREQTSWCEDPKFWDEMFDKIKNLKYLDLYGGEPLMTKEHFKFLKRLVNEGLSSTITLDYNTNGTVYSEKFFDLWKNFKRVKLSFSIDDIKERFEQQRRHASWDAVCDNIALYNKRQSEQFETEIFPTLNSQNLYYLPELIEWAETQGFGSMSFGILENPKKYRVSAMPIEKKQEIIDKFERYNYEIVQKIKLILETDITK